jgi:hypothetical protein
MMKFFDQVEQSMTRGFYYGLAGGAAISTACFFYALAEVNKRNRQDPGYKGLRQLGLAVLTPLAAVLIIAVSGVFGAISGGAYQTGDEFIRSVSRRP